MGELEWEWRVEYDQYTPYEICTVFMYENFQRINEVISKLSVYGLLLLPK